MSFIGHSQSLSVLTITLLMLYDLTQICETKPNKEMDDNSDLMYSDTIHGPQTAAAHQQVVFIDHGGGAISQIRRTSFFPNPSVPSPPFQPHVDHYPNSLYENNFADEPYANFPEDIPRIFERRSGETTPNPNDIEPQKPPPFIPHDIRSPQSIPVHIPPPPPVHLPPPQPVHHPLPPQAIAPVFHQPLPQHISHPMPQSYQQPFSLHNQFPHPIPLHFSQPIQHMNPQPVPQPIPQPNPHPISQPIRHSIEPDIEDERFLIHNEIERIPKPSNQMEPTRRERPAQEQPINPFFNFADGPQLFPNFDSPFDTFSPQNAPVFQRRRLTTNNNNNNNNNGGQDLNPNSIGYPSYTYYKGGGEENPSLTNWPKIFKFTDGRSDLYEFEKQKKMNKIQFNSKETYFDRIQRDSFLILHGGTFAQ